MKLRHLLLNASPSTPVRARSAVALLAAACLAAGAPLSGCAHAGGSSAQTEQTTERKLLLLESGFAEFVAVQLDEGDEGEALSVDETFARIEHQTARLESLRLRYLDVIDAPSSDRQRLLAMVRISELHLDLASRVRRIRYPADATGQERRAFDDRLSRIALPLEAVGLGVCGQLVEYADRRHLDGRFIRRARLYQAMHGAERTPLEDRDFVALRDELTRVGPYTAPRRLLETGRVGQAAARR